MNYTKTHKLGHFYPPHAKIIDRSESPSRLDSATVLQCSGFDCNGVPSSSGRGLVG